MHPLFLPSRSSPTSMQGLNFIASFMLLHTKDEGEAFALLVRTMQAPPYAMRGCVLQGMPDVAGE